VTEISEYEDHLLWAAEALKQPSVPPDRRKELAALLERARARAADSQLHIAVIGETSSGKSTLINAFLRQRLLPSSALVTTRTTLTIRHHDGEAGLRARGPGGALVWPPGRDVCAADGPPGALAAAVEAALCAGDQSRPGLDSVLRVLLTTDVADSLDQLELLWPEPLLGKQITLTDTPGFSVDDAGHRDRAVAAAERADLVLVVVPAIAAVSLRLVEFLQGPLQDHRDRCVFLLTKIDLVDEAERDEVVRQAELRLRRAGFEDPVVLPCSPGPALAAAGQPNAPALLSLGRIETRLVRLTAELRSSAISATLLGLISGLLRANENSAVEYRARLAAAERELGRLSLPDLPAFLEGWSGQALLGGQRAAEAAWSSRSVYFADDLEEEVRSAVASAQPANVPTLQSAAAVAAREYLRDEANVVLWDAVGRTNAWLKTTVADLAEDFADQFGRLARLAGAQYDTPATPEVSLSGLSVPDLDNIDSALKSSTSDLSTSVGLRTGGGAAAGAVLGSIIAPGVGTVIGGLIGALAGKPSADAVRKEFLDGALSVVRSTRSQVASAVGREVARIGAECGTHIDRVRDTYLREWSDEVRRLTKQEARARSQLAARIAEAEQAVRSSRERREQIAILRRALRKNRD
jgi:GTPase SAR1 family protein